MRKSNEQKDAERVAREAAWIPEDNATKNRLIAEKADRDRTGRSLPAKFVELGVLAGNAM